MSPQQIAEHADQQAQQERYAPAPVVQGIGREAGGQQCSGRRSQQHPDRGTAAGHGGGQAAAVGWRMFDHEGEGGCAFTADRQPLDHAQQRQQDGGGQTQRLVARQHSHQEGRDGHRRHREAERGASAVAVADHAGQQAAQRPHQVTDGEDAECRQHLCHRITRWKKRAADRDGEIAVDREVIPFEHVADGAGGDETKPAARVH